MIKRKGWQGQSGRHSKAARGIKTGRKKRNFSFHPVTGKFKPGKEMEELMFRILPGKKKGNFSSGPKFPPEGWAFVDWKDPSGKKWKDVVPKDLISDMVTKGARITKVKVSEENNYGNFPRRIRVVKEPQELGFGEYGFLQTKEGIKKITRKKITGDIKEGWVDTDPY